MEPPVEVEFIKQHRALYSNAVDGYIKLKLVHATPATVVVPDLLAANLHGMKWFEPKFFYACSLTFFEGFAAGNINIELSTGALVRVTLTSGQYVGALNDGSQVYRCLILGVPDLFAHSAGTCSLATDGDRSGPGI